MKTKNEKFNEMLNRFYENGVMKEVYASDKAIVCNVFNQFYFLISVEIIEWECRKEQPSNFNGKYPVFAMNQEGLRWILKYEDFTYEYYGFLPKEIQSRALRFLDESLLQHLVKNKDTFEKRPIGPQINLEFEKAVIELGKGALELFPDEEEKSKKRRFFGLF